MNGGGYDQIQSIYYCILLMKSDYPDSVKLEI